MVRDIDNDAVNRLRTLYQKKEFTQPFFEWAANRQKDATETAIERLAYKANIDRRDAIDIAHDLEKIGCGKFIVGRRGAKSRIQWRYSLRSIGEAAKGQPVTLQEIENKAVEPEDDADDELPQISEEMIRHSYQLRPDIAITIDLPMDFSKKEADRLAAFIQSLPFDV